MKKANKTRTRTSKSSTEVANTSTTTTGNEACWNQNANMPNYNALPIVETENYDFLNTTLAESAVVNNDFIFDFRMNRGDGILEDFSQLLCDVENEALAESADFDSAHIVNHVEPNTFLNIESIHVKEEPLAMPSQPIKKSPPASSAASQTSQRSSQSIQSIFFDHDYLSRENTLTLLHSNDETLLLHTLGQAEVKPTPAPAALAPIPAAATSVVEPQCTTKMTVPNDVSVNIGNIPVSIESTQPTRAECRNDGVVTHDLNKAKAINSIESFVNELSSGDRPLNANELSELVKELQQHAIKYKNTLINPTMAAAPAAAASEKKKIVSREAETSNDVAIQTEPSPSTSDDTARYNFDGSVSSNDTDKSLEFSCSHSEPLEYASQFDASENGESTAATDAGKYGELQNYFVHILKKFLFYQFSLCRRRCGVIVS